MPSYRLTKKMKGGRTSGTRKKKRKGNNTTVKTKVGGSFTNAISKTYGKIIKYNNRFMKGYKAMKDLRELANSQQGQHVINKLKTIASDQLEERVQLGRIRRLFYSIDMMDDKDKPLNGLINRIEETYKVMKITAIRDLWDGDLNNMSTNRAAVTGYLKAIIELIDDEGSMKQLGKIRENIDRGPKDSDLDDETEMTGDVTPTYKNNEGSVSNK